MRSRLINIWKLLFRNFPVTTKHSIFLLDLYKERITSHHHPLLEKSDHIVSSVPPPFTLNKSFVTSNYLFFIKDTPEITLKPRWFLVQVNHKAKAELKMNSLDTVNYNGTFVSWYKDDSYLCDDVAGWWLEWYEYHLDNKKVPIYSNRIIFGPTQKPNL